MKVKDMMQESFIKVFSSTSLSSLFDLLKDYSYFPLVPVVDSEDKLVGVVKSENLLDILRPPQAELFRNMPFVKVKEEIFDLEPAPLLGKLIIVDDIINRHFEFIKETDSLIQAYKVMRELKRERFPVVNSEGKLVGTLELFDVIKAVFKKKEVV